MITKGEQEGIFTFRRSFWIRM